MIRTQQSDLERFHNSYTIEGECWVWRKTIHTDGYGVIKIGSRTDGSRKNVKAHRFAYENLAGKIPEGLVIDHLCRNRPCVNPDHMEPVTPLVNHSRGREPTKLYCKHGHPLFGPNMRLDKRGGRVCIQCNKDRCREWSREKREVRHATGKITDPYATV